MENRRNLNIIYLTALVTVFISFTFLLSGAFAADLTKISPSHPRIHINSSNISALQIKLGPGGLLNSEYISLKNGMSQYCTTYTGPSGFDITNANGDQETPIAMACALPYLIEGALYSNWATLPIGSATEPAGLPGFSSDDSAHYLEMLSITFDWLYNNPNMTSANKQKIYNNITTVADSFMGNYQSTIKLDDYHNYMTEWIGAMMAAGLAIYGDPIDLSNKGATYINFATQAMYEGLTFTNPYGESVKWKFSDSVSYSGGYSDFEGPGYFKNGIPEEARGIEAWDTATLKFNNMWNTQFSTMINAGYFIMYSYTPNYNMMKFEDTDPTSTTVSAKYIAFLSLLEGKFGDGYIKSFIDTAYSSVNDWSGYGNDWKVFYLLYYDPSVTAINYKTLPTDLKADNYNIMKSGWNNTDNFVAFKAGTHYGYHSHSDHNDFFIWSKGNILTAQGGMYGYGTGGQCQTFDDPTKNHTAWNRQSISGNNISVYDPTDTYYWGSGTSAPNAGGQRMPYLRHNPPYSSSEYSSNMPWSGYMLANNTVTSEIFKFAAVKVWEPNDSYYAHVRSDATKAYTNNYSGSGHNENSKVNLAEREFVYVKPNYVVTYDRVNTKSASYTKSYVLHSIGAPYVYDGRSWNVSSAGVTDFATGSKAYMDTGTSRLLMKTLLPSTNFKYHVIGGTGYENYIESTAIDYAPDCAVADYNMRWRVEVRPTDSQANYVFLNLLEIADNTHSDIVASSLVTTGSGNMQGVLINDATENKVVLFSADANGAAVTGPISYSITTTAKSRHFLFNLLPNTSYNVTINGTTTQVTSNANGTAVLANSGLLTGPAPPAVAASSGGGGGGGGGCFIATAAYGSPLSNEIRILTAFRAKYLLTNAPGRMLASAYARYSPPIADFIRDKPTLRMLVRAGIFPIILFSRFMLGSSAYDKLAAVTVLIAALAGIVILSRIAYVRRSRG